MRGNLTTTESSNMSSTVRHDDEADHNVSNKKTEKLSHRCKI